MASIQERKTKNGETRYRVQIRMKGQPVQCATFKGMHQRTFDNLYDEWLKSEMECEEWLYTMMKRHTG